MVRQVALGAVVAFALTVLALSVWKPSEPAPSAPAPAPAAPPTSAPAQLSDKSALVKPTTILRPERVMLQRQLPAPLIAVDAGVAP